MNYIAYTIGPIYETIFDTLNDDNKTKKLKAGSYYFSFFMKTLLKNIKDEFDILVPYVDGDALSKKHKMGLFHDRLVAKSQKSKDEIRDRFDIKIKDTFKELASLIKDESIATNLMANMDNHLVVASEEELKKIDKNIIFALNQILDSLELQRDFSFDIDFKNYIKEYQNLMIKEFDRVKNLSTLSKGFDYYAVIVADGDKMGAKIKEIATENPEKIKNISEKLYRFFTNDDDIHKITNDQFNGELIYAGGDDILAFLPVRFDDVTFLDYINVLDKRFKEIVGEDTSLSFGVNIVYKKYPLRDAINSAFDLLYKVKNNGQNSISIKITKHSGQWFGSTMFLNTKIYNKYKELVDGILKEDITLAHSLHHSLKRYKEAIISTYADRDASIKALFDTVFNDSREKKEKEGLRLVCEYFDIYRPKKSDEFDDIFSQLSLVKFLRRDRV